MARIDELIKAGRTFSFEFFPPKTDAEQERLEGVLRDLEPLRNRERQRAAISLVHYQGLSNAEAAEVLRVNVRALESHLARGRGQLRERLKDLRSAEGTDV